MGILSRIALLSNHNKRMFISSKKIYKLFNIKQLSKSDIGLLLDLYKKSEAYFQLVQGKKASIEDVKDLLESLPPKKQYKDKFVLGLVSNEKKLIACVDLIRDYPKEHTWCIGFFLVTPELRGIGFSSKIYQDLECYLQTNNANNLRLVVHEKNTNAYQFWSKNGFTKTNEAHEMYGNKKVRVDILEKKVASSTSAVGDCNLKLF